MFNIQMLLSGRESDSYFSITTDCPLPSKTQNRVPIQNVNNSSFSKTVVVNVLQLDLHLGLYLGEYYGDKVC